MTLHGLVGMDRLSCDFGRKKEDVSIFIYIWSGRDYLFISAEMFKDQSA